MQISLRTFCLLGISAVALFFSCRKNDREEKIEPYTIVGYEQYTPGGFADYAYDSRNSNLGIAFRSFNFALNETVKAKNVTLGAKMALEAGKFNPDWGYRKYIINYPSIDAQGRPVTLSEVVIVPVGTGWDHKLGKVFLCSHYTILADFERPTGDIPDYLTGTAASDAVFICPDQEGYGATADHIHPCMANDAVARQIVDGALAAFRLLDDEGIKLEEGYRLYNGGYSLGGAYALAVHKYIETRCTPEERAVLRLEESYCGAGPYSPLATIRWYLDQENVYYTCALSLLIDGMIYSFPECFPGIRTEDYFSEKFIGAGVIDLVRSKEYASSYLLPYIRENVGERIDEILSEEARTPGSRIILAMEKALAKCDLTEGWLPEKPVILYHNDNDGYVPYENVELAMAGLGEGNIKVKRLPSIMPDNAHVGAGFFYFSRYIVCGF